MEELLELLKDVRDDVAVPATEIIPSNFNSAQAIYDIIQRLK